MPEENISIYGDIIRREFLIPAGTELVSHKHPYDHLSILYSGQAELTKRQVVTTLTGPCTVEIQSGIEHKVKAITDCRWDCLHSLGLAEWAHERGDKIVMKDII